MASRGHWLRSIRLRVLLPFAVANLLGALAIALWLVDRFEATLIAELDDRARTVSDIAVYAAETVDEEVELHGLIDGLARDNHIQLLVVAVGEPLRVVGTTHRAWMGRLLDEIDDADVRTDLRVAAGLDAPLVHLHEEQWIFDRAARVAHWGLGRTEDAQRASGAVVVHLDANPIRLRVEAETRALTLRVFGIGVLVCVVSYLALFRYVLRPVRAIDEAMQRRTAGDPAARAPRLAEDELGRLAETLNGMLEALVREENRYRSLVANMPGAVFRCRPEHHLPIDLLSPQIESITGRDAAYWMQPGVALSAALHPDDRPSLEARIVRSVQDGEPFEAEVRVIHASGEMRWALIRVHLSRDDAGRPSALEGLILDITERRRAEAELRDSQERLRWILDSASDGVIVISVHGRIVQSNRSAEQVFGWSQQEMVGHNVSMLMPEPWASEHDAYLRRFLETENRHIIGQRRELVGLRRDGSEFPIEVSVGEIVLPGGQRFFAGTVRDITDRREAESERMRYLLEVEEARDRIERQAAELAGVAEELAGARDAAERGSRAKSEFLATMSHEIRTPMNGVIGMTRLLLETPLDGEQREYAESVQRSAEALLTVINDILDFSKIEAGRLVIEPLPFDLPATLDDLMQLFAPRADEKGIELVLRVSKNVPSGVTGDAGRIRQILVNLMGNALKFTATGHVLLDVDARPSATGVHLVLRVEDTGIGIPADKHAEIFEKFVQADASTTRKYGGTGLGLSITRRLVDLMGGTLSLESEPGRGTTFRVELTLCVSADDATQRREQHISRPLRLLVVDDHPLARSALIERLQAIGFLCEGAGTASEALELLSNAVASKRAFELVLIDAVLRGETGADLAHALRRDERLRTLPLVLLSAAGVRGDAHFRELGFAACLAKPVRLAQLCDALEALGVDSGTAMNRTRAASSQPLARGLGALLSLGRTLRVLVAEDNPVNQKLARKLLERLGCEVTIAENGRLAVERVREELFDTVFMDMQMPEMDGLDATRAIRALVGEAGRVPIIAMTANAMDGDRERCLESGMNDYVSKPIDPQRLAEALGRWVGAEKTEPSGAA